MKRRGSFSNAPTPSDTMGVIPSVGSMVSKAQNQEYQFFDQLLGKGKSGSDTPVAIAPPPQIPAPPMPETKDPGGAADISKLLMAIFGIGA